MIRKDLKVGDKFTDGNRTFIVEAVCGEGVYISKCIADEKVEKIEEKTEEQIKEVEEPTYTKTEINRMPKDELEKLCETKGLEKGTTSEMKKSLLALLGL